MSLGDGRDVLARSAAAPTRVFVWALHMAIPLLGLWLLVARPRFDARWQHQQAHFWLVIGVALVNVAIGLRMSEQTRRRRDARLFLVSLVFLATAGFLALHALGTPGVVVGGNAGFVAATPVGLLLGAVLAVASSIEFTSGTAAAVMRWQRPLRLGLIALLAAWAVAALLRLEPLDRSLDADETRGPLVVVAAVGTVLYVVAAARYFLLHRRRPAVMLISVITAFVLLAEAMIVVAYARNWHASWWAWHLLMTAAFLFVAYSAHVQYAREGSATGLFNGISLEATIRGIREEYGQALEELVTAMRDHAETGPDRRLGPVAARLGARFGLTERQVEVLEEAAEALAREREHIQHLGALVGVGQQASVIRDESELLGRALALTGRAFGRDHISVALLRAGRLEVIPGGDPSPLARQVAESMMEGEELDDGRAALALPLTVKGHAAGVLHVERQRGGFADRDRFVLRSLASQLSIAVENARLYRQIEGLFRQYMSPQVATALLADPEKASLGGAVREVTILFADLRGFTPFSERTPPEEVVALLNRYFGVAVPAILVEGGTVVQFVGDAVMALFNAPVPQPDHAPRAARAALAMQRAIASIAAEHQEWPRFRIGINSGPALVGNIGSDEMRNFTAIGDTINLAARLEGVAQEGQVVLGPATRALLADGAVVEPLGPLTLKGKGAPVEAFLLVELRAS